MDINEILKTKLDKCIDAFDQFNSSTIEANTKVINEMNAGLSGLRNELKEINIPSEIIVQHSHQHYHINAGVRFMIVVLISVILISSSFSYYFYSQYLQIIPFKKDYTMYQKNYVWMVDFFNFMKKTDPDKTNIYIDTHQLQ